MRIHTSRSRRAIFLFTLQFWISLAITGFFGTMMFLLWQREVSRRVGVEQLDISPDLLDVTWVDYDQFMWIERAGKRIGAYALLVRRNPDFKSYEMTTQMRMEMPVFNQQLTVKFDVYCTMNNLFDMQTFQAGLDAAGEKATVNAFTEGLNLYYQADGPAALIQGGNLTSSMRLDKPIILKDAIRPVVAVARKLEVGDKWTAVASDPITGKFNVPVEVEVVGEEEIVNQGEKILTRKVSEKTEDVETFSWYDEQGFVVRTQIGKDIVLERDRRQNVEERFPEFKATLVFPEIDRAAMKLEAAKSPEMAAGQGLMPGLLPNL